ncbi:carbon-nitrogen hydrolase family protein [Roseovarius sp. MMSF_3281]|uniref:carbon-nitrogen hydrolase family protein n=1 Tax=Roseovarius sp. MMSF_3281 TaxID=3046694 RepID=UPI00273D58D6|nr:carbon-nitrogen hydrolase family protein [Roseovarius sp. MMSF_3281]
MKIATAAYPLDQFNQWSDYATKLEAWVSEAAGQGADLLVFPEYGAMELATLNGPDVAADLPASLRAISDKIPQVDALHAELAAKYGVYICAASAPVYDDALGPDPVNRARLFSPSGEMGIQDKQIMTRWERAPMGVVPGGPLTLFDTALGKIGILICYDSEFPLLARALAEADILLVPSCTEALEGYWRVRIGAMARALEGQCVTVMASTVGDAQWNEVADLNTGMGGIFGPPDAGFPPTGVLAEGTLNTPGWTVTEVDVDAISRVRADGNVLNATHWNEQPARVQDVTQRRLR